jgi:hypothetical protein
MPLAFGPTQPRRREGTTQNGAAARQHSIIDETSPRNIEELSFHV